MRDQQTVLQRALQENNLILTEDMQGKLLAFLELMQQWNRVFNLTTIDKPIDMIYLHLIDSLIIAPHLKGKRMLDVGSGAGLPGIPLAILNQDQEWTLLDKNSKKTRFLTQVVSDLALTNVKVVHHSAKDFKPTYCFDSILSRALGSIRMFVESCQHLLCDHGIFIAMKGKYPQTELTDIPAEFNVQQVARLTIKGIDNLERHVICLSKTED